jgi:hypothetical protein
MKILYLSPFRSNRAFSNYAWASALDADVAVPLIAGEPILDHMRREYSSFLAKDLTHLHEPFMSDQYMPRGFSGEILVKHGDEWKNDCIDSYQTVLLPFIWYLLDTILTIRKTAPGVHLVGLHDDALEEILLSTGKIQRYYCCGLTELDLFICYNEQMHTWAKALTRCRLVNHPVDLTEIETGPVKETNPLVCLGVGTWNNDFANVVTNIAVFRAVRSRVENLTGELLGARPEVRQQWEALTCKDGDISVAGWLDDGYYRRLGSYHHVIHLSQRACAGRIAAECAHIGVPVVGNLDAQMQRQLWPELSTYSWDAQHAASLSERLLIDPTFYRECVLSARNRLADLSTAAERDIVSIKEVLATPDTPRSYTEKKIW